MDYIEEGERMERFKAWVRAKADSLKRRLGLHAKDIKDGAAAFNKLNSGHPWDELTDREREAIKNSIIDLLKAPVVTVLTFNPTPIGISSVSIVLKLLFNADLLPTHFKDTLPDRDELVRKLKKKFKRTDFDESVDFYLDRYDNVK